MNWCPNLAYETGGVGVPSPGFRFLAFTLGIDHRGKVTGCRVQ